ncbi:MAG: peroxiredoxin-like family protein [Saprospiraceae bacterium]|nr:peroxiredoxin-like family protein [Saprospiraceae bacterium]
MPNKIPDISIKTTEGSDIHLLSWKTPVLLVFLRHFGCTFCREALADIKMKRSDIEERGVKIVLVHMAEHEIAREYFQKFDLVELESVSDPPCDIYAAFGLLKGSFKQLFGLRSWIRGFDAGVVQGHGVGMMLGDGFQMPGVFLLKNGKIESEFIHKYASDRPDYSALIDCCTV